MMRLNLVFLLVVSAVMVSCSQAGKRNSDVDENSDEVSLKADRSQYDELRKDISPEVKRENDELAGLLQLLRNPSGEYEKPERIRERFNKIIRDKRERMDKTLRRDREDFARLEKDQREEFQQKQKDERKDFTDDKPSREESRRFFDKQDAQRRRFYSDAQDKRRTFEAQTSSQRRDFEDYVREKTNTFNQEYRAYQKEYEERMKGEDLKRRMDKKAQSMPQQPKIQPDLSGPTGNEPAPTPNEFDEIPQGGSQLGTGDN